MERTLYQQLLAWKSAPRRKPLLLRGARQTGKTHLLKSFGMSEYETLAYFNFEADPLLKQFFPQRVRPAEIIEHLSLYANRPLHPERTLIFFDEIQASNDALKSLKYFCEESPQYHVVAAGSLLGITLSGPGAFPVGKVNLMDLFPLNFMEFLGAINAHHFQNFLTEKKDFHPLPEPLHLELIKHLRTYYFTGGMPEVVDYYATSRNLLECRKIQLEILDAYTLDFAKYAAAPDIPKLSMVWDAIPQQLGKPNKKFVFSDLKKSARRRDFENALEWLEKSGLILRAYRIQTAKQPLKAYLADNIFKIYALDIGLLGAVVRIDPSIMIQGDRIFREFEGTFVENYVAQQLNADQRLALYYWQSAGTAEVDFVCEHLNTIVPLEAKAGINPRSKSLKAFGLKYGSPILVRTTLLNLKREKGLVNFPLYALNLFPRLLDSL